MLVGQDDMVVIAGSKKKGMAMAMSVDGEKEKMM